VVIAASAGSVAPLRHIVATLPIPCLGSIFIVLHIGSRPSMLPSILGRGGLPASFGQDGARIEAGHIYVAPPDHHMVLGGGRIRLNQGPKIHHTRPAGDPLFISAAEAYGERVVGVVLSGGDGDGAAGLRIIKQCGGTTLVQHPDDAMASSMPEAAIAADHPDCLPIEELARRLGSYCSGKRSKSS